MFLLLKYWNYFNTSLFSSYKIYGHCFWYAKILYLKFRKVKMFSFAFTGLVTGTQKATNCKSVRQCLSPNVNSNLHLWVDICVLPSWNLSWRVSSKFIFKWTSRFCQNFASEHRNLLFSPMGRLSINYMTNFGLEDNHITEWAFVTQGVKT